MGTKAVKQRKISFLYVAAVIIFAAYVLIRIFSYQVSINAQAAENEEISKQIAEQENVTEQLKADNAMLWVQKMNEIQSRVREIIYSEIIYA